MSCFKEKRKQMQADTSRANKSGHLDLLTTPKIAGEDFLTEDVIELTVEL
jgi:hypothetical protein